MIRILALLGLFFAGPAAAQSARVYAQISFRNGGALIVRDSGKVRVEIRHATNASRGLVHRPTDAELLSAAYAMRATLPDSTMTFAASYEWGGFAYRCRKSDGCWVTIINETFGGYFRPRPNVPASRLPDLSAALTAAWQGTDVPPFVLDLRP